MKYVVKKRNKIYEVLDISYPFKGYKFNSKSNNISSITIINKKLIDKVLNIKITNMIKKAIMLVNEAFNSDDDETGTMIALDEILMVKNAIKNKYNKYLSKEKQSLYLKKLDLIEEEMKEKVYMYQVKYFMESSGKKR